MIFTARKRSLGQGNVFILVCHSVHRGSLSQHASQVAWQGGSVPRRVSVQGGLCPVGSLSGRPPPRTVTSGWYASYLLILPSLAKSGRCCQKFNYFQILDLRETNLAAHCNKEFIVIFSTTEPLSDWPGFRLLYFCCKIPSLARIRFHEIKKKTRIDIAEKIMIITSLSCTSFNVWNKEIKENAI